MAGIVCEQLTKTYRGATALRGLSLTVAEGRVLALLGPNGSGKTTTTRLLATLTPADSGVARVAGYDVTREPARVRGVIGLTAQATALDGFLKGAEHLDLVARMHHIGQPDRRRRVLELLAEFELDAVAGARVATYSGGMRRRLDIAGSLISNPSVLFLDEPTTGLDPQSRARLWETVRDRAARGMTILLTTQYMDEADALADTAVVLVGGEIVASGAPRQIKDLAGGPVAELLVETSEPDEAVERALRLAGGKVERRGQPGEWAVSLPDSSAATVARLIDRAALAGVGILDISVRPRTLDEAFIALTQNVARGAREPGEMALPAPRRC